jgi:RNA polymerase sigma-70 factor, ECF subfamily
MALVLLPHRIRVNRARLVRVLQKENAMTQIGQTIKSATRRSAGKNTVQTRLASEYSKPQAALSANSVLAEHNDALLVAAAQSGLNEAFEVLVRRYQAKILSMAWRFTRNREDAEDLTQQAFQKAFLHLRQFQGNSAFSTWLTRIAMNEALMWARKKRGSSEVSLEIANVNNEVARQLDPADLAPNPEETCLQRERQRMVCAAVNRLRPRLRRVMELRELAELSTQETAAVMGLSVAAVKARRFHGRTKLRLMLKRFGRSRQASVSSRRARGVASNQLVFACK